MQFILNLLLASGLIFLINAQDFDHKNQAVWYDDFPECRGERQSPIELNSVKALPVDNYSPLVLYNFDTPITTPAEIWNNGHTANVELPSDNLASITGGPLKNNLYITKSLHLHWGSKNFHGCEHIVDGHRCSMELHFVNRNSKYATIDLATQHKDGLAVLAILFDVDPNLQQDFVGLNSIIDGLGQIVEYNNSTELINLVLADLLGEINFEKVLSYEGSLTTPPCSEAVTWIIPKQRISISEEQINHFRALKDINGDNLVNNYRFLQPKNKRQVFLFG